VAQAVGILRSYNLAATMNLHVARRSLRLRQSLARPLLVTGKRQGSTSAHHHEEHHVNPAVYTRESPWFMFVCYSRDADDTPAFFTPFWRNTLIITFIGLGVYNFGGDGAWLTRWIKESSPKKEDMDKLNEANLYAAALTAEDGLVTARAKRPHIVRYRTTR
jgi:hypothetical protein